MQYLYSVFVDYEKLWMPKGKPLSKKHVIDLIKYRIKSADKRLIDLNKSYYDHINFSMSIEKTLINIIEHHCMHNELDIVSQYIIDNIKHYLRTLVYQFVNSKLPLCEIPDTEHLYGESYMYLQCQGNQWLAICFNDIIYTGIFNNQFEYTALLNIFGLCFEQKTFLKTLIEQIKYQYPQIEFQPSAINRVETHHIIQNRYNEIINFIDTKFVNSETQTNQIIIEPIIEKKETIEIEVQTDAVYDDIIDEAKERANYIIKNAQDKAMKITKEANENATKLRTQTELLRKQAADLYKKNEMELNETKKKHMQI
jgi:vacuolar-type H+-ATPase subunit H